MFIFKLGSHVSQPFHSREAATNAAFLHSEAVKTAFVVRPA